MTSRAVAADALVWEQAGLRLDAADVDALQWAEMARRMHARGARLLSLWGEQDAPAARSAQPGGGGAGADVFAVLALWLHDDGLQLAGLRLPAGLLYPGLHESFPVAARLQRALRDLLGPRAQGMDPRPWLRHDAWPEHWHPLRRDAGARPPAPPAEPYAYVSVQGRGVHEIGVGPVHAGIIEPGQFRFSVLGEQVLRLEQRLGWTHKGVAALLRGRDAAGVARLGARLSGDSTVAGAWAACMALETAARVRIPPRALWLRALLLERERVANHLADIGAIAGDTGLAFGLSQFSLLKEQVLRLNLRAFGARWPMDALCPGGVRGEPDEQALRALDEQCLGLRDDARVLLAAFEQHAGLQDRLRGTGRIEPDLARRLGMLGLAARASGQTLDLRVGMAPYDKLELRIPVHVGGDVAARLAQRFDELFESLRLCRELLRTLPAGELLAPWPRDAGACAPGWALGLIEGWRGPVLVALRMGRDGSVEQAHTHDGSWQNWPALEWAAARDIVADFPLINKSFNLSYSGHDG